MPRPAYSSTHEWWIWAKSTITGQKPADETYNQLNSTRGLRAQHADAPNNNAGKDTQEFHAKVAAAKLMGITKAEEKYRVKLDKSLYGAAIMMPQIARSAGWPKNICVLMCRSYIFLLVNYTVQGMILFFIAKEEIVWDSFGGQMFLCDFGKDSGGCPGGANCIGPSGTEYTPSRVYSWDLWTTRMYVRDSLKALFPDRVDDINTLVDPGEYGVESYYCRLLCCALFTVTVMSDLWGSINMLWVFIDVPNKAECWVDYEEPTWADKEHAKAIHGWTELDLVTLKIAGMPLSWKIFNVLVVLLPKMLLWKITAEAGILFLMETSGIEDIVVNSVALAFILQIDELLCNELMSDSTRAILEKLEDYHLENYAKENNVEDLTDEELYQQNEEQINAPWGIRQLMEIFPLKLLLVFLLTWFFVDRYYTRHCVTSEAGGLVSHSMRLPLGTEFSLLNAFFQSFAPVTREEEPFWTMPSSK
mmetsp:Transcript_72939/g.128826  ORF Transcript_72939/g.128826 Transcript_72939/m.128826 type:complete len:475 (+) Transcript_72939:64-1488(+)